MAEWITTRDATQLSGYHADHLRRLIRAGEVKARKFGIVWQVHKASLLTYIHKAAKSEDKRWGAKKRN